MEGGRKKKKNEPYTNIVQDITSAQPSSILQIHTLLFVIKMAARLRQIIVEASSIAITIQSFQYKLAAPQQ